MLLGSNQGENPTSLLRNMLNWADTPDSLKQKRTERLWIGG